MGWFPYLNSGAHIYFDDVDTQPFRCAQRKDNFLTEVEWEEIKDYVKAFFYSNADDLYLDIMYGTTGLAHLYKLSPKGTVPRVADPIVHRHHNVVNTARYSPRTLLATVKRKLIGGPSE